MEWIFWMFGIWFVMSLVGRRTCSRAWWGDYERRRMRAARAAGLFTPDTHRALHEAYPALGDRRSSRRVRRAPKQASRRIPEARQETPEERIRRRFVEGRIDLDRYEAELWEELRPK